MSKEESFMLIRVLLAAFVLFMVFATYMAVKESKQRQTMKLYEDEWTCTDWRTRPVGMAMGRECRQWTRK